MLIEIVIASISTTLRFRVLLLAAFGLESLKLLVSYVADPKSSLAVKFMFKIDSH